MIQHMLLLLSESNRKDLPMRFTIRTIFFLAVLIFFVIHLSGQDTEPKSGVSKAMPRLSVNDGTIFYSEIATENTDYS